MGKASKHLSGNIRRIKRIPASWGGGSDFVLSPLCVNHLTNHFTSLSLQICKIAMTLIIVLKLNIDLYRLIPQDVFMLNFLIF